jgi:IMP dehydrogenase
MKILKSKSVYYDDVNLIAQPSEIISRSHIERELHRIIVSPMQAVVGKTFARTAYNYGVSVALHRFCKIDELIETFEYVNESNDFSKGNKIWCSVALNDYSAFEALYQNGARNFIIDIANGYLSSVDSMIKCLNYDYKGSETSIMVGNIHTEQGLNLYKNYDNVWVRVGIGQGSGCTTKDQTGYTRGQITEISECYNDRVNSNNIIADGGIKNGGDAAKAFGAGADYVMMGGYFAKTNEAQNVIDGVYQFWGSASKKQLELSGKKRDHAEGRTYNIDQTQIEPLKNKIDELWSAISSAVSYSGYQSLSEFIGRGIYEIKER